MTAKLLLCSVITIVLCIQPGEAWSDTGRGFAAISLKKDNVLTGLELGMLEEASSSLRGYGSLALLFDGNDLLTGANGGLRFHQGNQYLSLFIGLGCSFGYSNKIVSREHDRIDNDGDGLIDESGETEKVIDRALATLYPEVGVEIALVPRHISIITYGRYQAALGSQEENFPYYGFALTFGY